MKNLVLQDPKTFGEPNKEKVSNTIKLFFSENKEQFINNYYKLDNTDKFYTLAVCFIYLEGNLEDISIAKKIFLEELREDLMILRVLNKPKGKDLGFGYQYKGYFEDMTICDRLKQFNEIIGKMAELK
jgi:hypothetical protein